MYMCMFSVYFTLSVQRHREEEVFRQELAVVLQTLDSLQLGFLDEIRHSSEAVEAEDV